MGWEHGAGRGHLGVLWPLARSLAADGVELVLFVRDLTTARSMPPLPRTRVLPLPYVDTAGHQKPAGPAHTLADILCGLGLSDAATLSDRVKAWREVLAREKPDVVVAEFAPALALAAMGDWPVVTVGVGYVCPPVGGPFPPIRFWESEVPLASVQAEERLADAMDAARAGSRLPSLARPSDSFGGDAQVVCTWPELDAYADRRLTPAVGPARRFVSAAAERESCAFFYLADDIHLSAALQAVSKSGLPAHGYIRGLDVDGRARLARPGLKIRADPPELDAVLPGCAVLIHHGGVGAAEAALASGTPQMILARHLEQVCNGVAVQRRLGVGKTILAAGVARDTALVAADIRRVAEDRALRDRASALAATLAARGTATGASAARHVIGRILNQPLDADAEDAGAASNIVPTSTRISYRSGQPPQINLLY